MSDLTAQARRGARILLVGTIAAGLAAVCSTYGLFSCLVSRPDPAGEVSATYVDIGEHGVAASASPDEPDTGDWFGSIPPVLMPKDLYGIDVAGVAVPASPSAGPRDTAGGLARGFSHDPVGAVLAAANILIRVNPETGPIIFGPTLRQQVVGPHAAAALPPVESAYEQLRRQAGVAYGEPVGPIRATLRGFLLEYYSPDEAWLRLLMEGQGPDGQIVLLSILMEMAWVDGDWRWVAPAGEDYYFMAESAEEYESFWRGEP